jgi:hypothetical protein
MPDLTCPRCGLSVAATRPEDAIEHCPRCFARTRGAMSITLSPRISANRCRAPGVIARLTRLGGSEDAKS